MQAIGKFALIGAFSGALYGFWNFGFLQSLGGDETMVSEIFSRVSNQAGAGIFYGIIVGAALCRPLGLSRLGWLLFGIAAALSYYAAVNVAIGLYDRQQGDLFTALCGAVAGAVGSLLLGIATAVLASSARQMRFFALTIATGALVGLLLPVGLNADSLPMWIVFFALWQGAYAAATAFSLRLA